MKQYCRNCGREIKGVWYLNVLTKVRYCNKCVRFVRKNAKKLSEQRS